jgi:hypothetical protein
MPYCSSDYPGYVTIYFSRDILYNETYTSKMAYSINTSEAAYLVNSTFI